MSDLAGLPRILVVDDSKLVRRSLIQHVQGHYEVREEADGESAWQTLVLDQSIQAVISDLSMPKLDGYQLLARLRSSKLRRLQALPFILVTGEESEDERTKARSLGASDFIAKGCGGNEILARLNNLLALAKAQVDLDEGRKQMVVDPASELFTRKYIELQTMQALSHVSRHGGDVSLMVFGFDGFDLMEQMLGPTLAEDVGNRFAKMLAAKMRKEDSLGHYAPGQFAVLSPGTAPEYFTSFAERVRQAVEVSHLTAKGRPLSLTVSIGLASVPRDTVTSPGGLLALAVERMQAAMRAGGNRLDSGGVAGAVRPIGVQHALQLLAAKRPDAVKPHLESLLCELWPLLKEMDRELGLSLPLTGLEQRFGERNKAKT
ncbi:MAG: response regulator [Azonexus sp.]|nr:response regulator [Azonexus sp.]